MSRTHYEDFSGFADADGPSEAGGVQQQEERLAAFETGYQAGWDDAVKAQADEQRAILSSFATSLQEIDFGFQEASGEVLKSVETVIEACLEKLLPAVAAASLGPRVMEEVNKLLGEAAPNGLKVTVPPSLEPQISEMVKTIGAVPPRIEADADMPLNQAIITAEGREIEINFDRVIAETRIAIDALCDDAAEGKDRKNG